MVAFSAVEIIALVTAILVILKGIFFLFGQDMWGKWANSFINMKGYRWIAFVVFLVLFYFVVFMGGVSVVTLFAIWAVIAFFMHSVLFAYPKGLTALMKDFMRNTKENWLQMLIMFVLALWVLNLLFNFF
jgi:hypothetical protein